MKVVQGVPTSWELTISTKYFCGRVSAVTWSPCSRFIAFAQCSSAKIEILDAKTLGRIRTFTSPSKNTQWLSFSPDGCLLTGFSDELDLTNWDFQTGGLVSTISSVLHAKKVKCFSSAHSTDGKIIAVAYCDLLKPSASTAISMYNLVSRTYVSSHCVSKECIVAPIWAHNECFQFATVRPGHITIWEVGFTLIDTLVEVKTLPAPDEIGHARDVLFLHTVSRLAFTHEHEVLIWDTHDSRFLLKFQSEAQPQEIDFSIDGQLFARIAPDHGFYIWKECPTGYTFHQELIPRTPNHFRPCFSPNGGSIIAHHSSAIKLWHTGDPTPSLSGTPYRRANCTHFILALSPDETLVAVTRMWEKTITIIDLKCDELQLTIDTDMEILCLAITQSSIIVVGEGKVVTWNIPTSGHIPGTRVNTNNSVQTTMFDYPTQPHHGPLPFTSISPDLNRIAVIWHATVEHAILNIYDVLTGKCLVDITLGKSTEWLWMPWFTLDGCEVWCAGGSRCGWAIIEGEKPGLIELDPIGPNALPSGGFPWESPCGYEVTLDGWILSPGRKRLLWLPHGWRSIEEKRMWGGHILGLLHHTLPEAVILELCE